MYEPEPMLKVGTGWGIRLGSHSIPERSLHGLFICLMSGRCTSVGHCYRLGILLRTQHTGGLTGGLTELIGLQPLRVSR